jgi:hypothetical protein
MSFSIPSRDTSLASLSATLAAQADREVPSVLLLDGLSQLAQTHSPAALTRWIEAVLQSRLYSAVVAVVHADALASPASAFASASTPPVAALEALIQLSTTFLQALPMPPTLPPAPSTSSSSADDAGGCACVGGVRILHRKSTGKALAALEAIWLTRRGTLRGGAYVSDRLGADEVDAEAEQMESLRKLTKGLSFSLDLTDRQRRSRDSVELPFVEAAMEEQQRDRARRQEMERPAPAPAPASSASVSTGSSGGVVSGAALLAEAQALGVGLGALDLGGFEEVEMDEEDVPDDDEEI